jgi:pimeloyl-ACP methyl ester carboxylesterase
MAGSQHVPDVQPTDWLDDLAALLDALNLPTVHLAAETFGSRIATRFAADRPERVSSLILNGVIAYSSPSADEERRRNSDPANIPEDRRRSLEEHHGSDWAAVNAFYLDVHGRPGSTPSSICARPPRASPRRSSSCAATSTTRSTRSATQSSCTSASRNPGWRSSRTPSSTPSALDRGTPGT